MPCAPTPELTGGEAVRLNDLFDPDTPELEDE